ncbi:MAG TPA: DUF3137 domain-containing protein, partial [bacterium]|nr:DUF3137 domain-containing protein [bacterium]
MRSLEDLHAYYEAELADDVRALDRQRLALLHEIGSALLVATLGSAGVFALVSMWDLPPATVAIPFFAAVALLFQTKGYDGYHPEFKLRLIRKLVAFLDPRLTYSEGGRIERGVFERSRLFATRPDRVTGGDLVTGAVGETSFAFSEIAAECRYEVRDDAGGRVEQWRTLFKGLFFTATFNRPITTELFVLPDTAEGWLGSSLGKDVQGALSLHGTLIKLEDGEFEQHFVVYGRGQVEARYVLTTALMERLVEFRRAVKRPLYLSVVGPYVH